MALGSIFGGFLVQVEEQNGSKLGPKSEKLHHQEDTKKDAQNKGRGGPRGDAVARRLGGGGAPLVLRTLHPEGPEGQALGSLQALAPQGCVADIYIYIY